MKVKLNFKNKSGLRVVINDSRDNTPDTRPVGERNSASTAGKSVVSQDTRGLLFDFEKALSRVLGMMGDIGEVGFATKGFIYDHKEFNSFRNLLSSTRHFINKNIEDLNTEGITDPFYRDEVIAALTNILNDIESIEDLKSNLSIREYNEMLKNMTAKEELDVDEIVDDVNSRDKAWWTNFYNKFKQKQYTNAIPDIGRTNKPVKAVKGENDDELYLVDEHGHHVLLIDVKNKSVRAFASTDKSDYDEDFDYDNVGETSDFDSFFGELDSEEDLGEKDLGEEDLKEEDLDVADLEEEDLDVEDLEEEDLELHLEDSIDVYSDIISTILSDRDLTRFIGRASKSAKSKLALLNDAKNLYELFEEKFGKKPAGVGKRIGSTYEYYLVDADGNNIGIVNQQTREVRDLSEVQIENNDPLDAALELVKNDPKHSNFNEDDESGYAELPDETVIAIFYTDETNYLALNLNEAEEYLYSDSIKKYIGLFNNFQDYLDGQMPNIKREVR